jgi:hypothetical protein
MNFHLGVCALVLLATACASPTTLVQKGRLAEAWRDVCERHADASAKRHELLSRDERMVFRREVEGRTRGTFSARALSRQSLHRRLGGTVFPKEVVLLITHVDVNAYPGAGILVTPWIVTQGETLREVELYAGTWRFSGLERPEPAYDPSVKPYSTPGLWADLIIAALTVGTIDPKFRGQKTLISSGSPASPGTGTDLQQQTLYQLNNASDDTEAFYGANRHRWPIQLGEANDSFYLLGAVPKSVEEGTRTLDTEPVPERKDLLILRIQQLPDRVSNAWCHLSYDMVIPLPEGPDLATRVNAIFANGSVSLGAP